MRDADLTARLRATDPVGRTDLSRIDPSALSALREGITMSMPEATGTRRRTRRLGRRGLFAAGISVVLVGGGAAYAGHLEFAGGAGDGVNCQHVWNETAMGVPAVMGPNLTGDPVTDCAGYVSAAGLSPILDPVAFAYDGMVFVTPSDQVPPDAVLLAPSPDGAASRELEASLRDWVDGGAAHCPDVPTATAFAQSELDRLGLDGWTVTYDGAARSWSCADSWVDIPKKSIRILANGAEDLEVAAGPQTSGVRDALRAGITDTCVSAGDARAVADVALAVLDFDPWPTTTVLDESAPCARVDMEVGGSIQVTVYGPTAAHP
ncbi:hypothetical protein [Cellulomonas sp. URHE0023]|uniref:hypothetical protein n=1 Tax=Cellulomonas sp. URHE0023 TaxID=1380354 RepID=UPI00047F757F|nr:hypothetical protein [Cellulomonas sp. URHE0023]